MTLRWIHEKPSPHEIWTITCGLLHLLSSFEMSISKAFVFLGFICKFVHRFSSYLTSLKIKEATHNQTVQWTLVWWGQSQGWSELKSSFGCKAQISLYEEERAWKDWILMPTPSYAFSVALKKVLSSHPNDGIPCLVVVRCISFQLQDSTTRVSLILETLKSCQ